MSSIALPSTLQTERKVFTATLALTAATALGAALRFYKLGEWSFWIDEIFQIRNAASIDTISEVVSSYYPLSYLLVRPSILRFGENAFGARLVPAALGIVTLLLLYVVAKKLVGRTAALLSVVLLAISPWHIYWSQNARFYTLLMIFFTIALVAFYWAIELDQFRLIVLAFVAWILGMTTHPTAVLLLPTFVIYALTVYFLPVAKPLGLRIRNLIPLTIVPLLLYVTYDSYRIFVTGRESIFLAFAEIFVGNSNSTAKVLIDGIIYRVGIPIVVLALIGGLLMLTQKARLGLILGLAIAVPMLVIVGLSPFTYTAFRYAFVTLPYWIMLASYAVVQLSSRDKRWGFLAFSILLIALALTQDHVLEDVTYYFGAWLRWIFLGLVALTAVMVSIVGFSVSRSGTATNWLGERVALLGGRSWQRYQGIWAAGILLPLLLHPLIADTMYFRYQHGYRDDWISATDLIREERDSGEVVFSSLPPLAEFYLAGEIDHIGNLDTSSPLSGGRRLWIIRDLGVQGYADELLVWIGQNCEVKGRFDNFASGRKFELSAHLCEGRTSSG